MTKFRFDPPVEFLNPLAQIFFVIGLVNGFTFTFFSHSQAVQAISFTTLAPHVVVPFGIILLILTAVNIWVLAGQHHRLGTAAAMLGFVAWLYMSILYIISGLWLAVVIYPLPQTVFWCWYFFAVKRLKED